MFYDFFIECQKYSNTIPAFSFIKDQTLFIHEYSLNQGQILGLKQILLSYPSAMDITKVDLCNCKAGDQGITDILEGLRALEMLTSFTY